MLDPHHNAPKAAVTAKGADGVNVDALAIPKLYHRSPSNCKRVTLRFRRDDGLVFTVHGQNAKAVKALVEAGAKGVTADEVSTWAYRFSAYCWELRHKFGLAIITVREPHTGGWHGRHVLQSPITILSTDA
jgi:hypothetical protein